MFSTLFILSNHYLPTRVEKLVCADLSPSRLERLKNVLHTFGPGIGAGRPGLPDVYLTLTPSLLKRRQYTSELFNRVLVDVPCSTDRSALTTDKGNVFSRGKAKVRAGLPVTQKSLLQ